MAHNIASINGRPAMAFVGANPWHNLGTKVEGAMNVDQAMRAASLDWTVTAEDLFLADGRKAPRVALVRNTDGKPILGTAGAGYTPIQNTEAFGIFNDAGVTIKTAGALGQGERVWMLAQMAGSIEVLTPGGEDKINGYLLIDTAHDGTGACNVRFTPIRVVCQNTLGAATSEHDAVIKVRHTKSATDRVAQAKDLVANMLKAMKETGDTFNAMAAKTLSTEDIRAYIESVLPTPKNAAEVPATLTARRAAVLQLVDEGRGAQLSQRTVWGVYNAVTEYVDHIKPREAATENGVRRAQLSAIFGAGDDLKMLALRNARQLVAV